MRKARAYYGVMIHWQNPAGGTGGYRLPWYAYVGGRFCYADTLEGIRAAIRAAR